MVTIPSLPQARTDENGTATPQLMLKLWRYGKLDEPSRAGISANARSMSPWNPAPCVLERWFSPDSVFSFMVQTIPKRGQFAPLPIFLIVLVLTTELR